MIGVVTIPNDGGHFLLIEAVEVEVVVNTVDLKLKLIPST